MHIRNETYNDIDAIRALNYSAFKDHPAHEPGAEPTEHLIVDRLRDANALSLSLVAIDNDQVVGHLAISPVALEGSNQSWFGLGPVAVLPSLQSKGIGSKMIRSAINEVSGWDSGGLVVMGDPKYYGRFGFEQLQAIQSEGIPAEYFMALLMNDNNASGNVAYHSAFFAK